MSRLVRYSTLAALAAVSLSAGERKAIIGVSAVVQPAARIEVQARTAATIRVTMNPNARVFVWAARDNCAIQAVQHVIDAPGVHQITFSADEVAGMNLVCLSSTDGSPNAFARLPE